MKITKLLLLSLACSFGAFAAPQELDRVAVVVNDGVVLQSDIDTSLKLLQVNARDQNQSLPAISVLREQVEDKLVLDTLQAQEAKRIGVSIDDQDLDKAIASIAENNNKSVSQLLQELNNAGISTREFRQQVRREVEANEARNALVRRRINIIPAEVDSLAKVMNEESDKTVQYRIEHIQLRADENNKAEVEAKAQELVAQLDKGANFKELAYTYSKGPKALEGGDWGWMRKEEMPTIFADQINLPNEGTIIGPFRSGVGYHILKIAGVKGLQTVSVTEVNARHILIKPTIILSDQGAQKELKEFRAEIESGEASFGQLASKYSQDPGSAAKQGNLGWQTPDLYVPEFKHQVETLPVGEISEPFKTVHGWHIVQVLERRKVDKTESAMKNRAYQLLFRRKFNEEATAWTQELKASAYIEKIGSDTE